MMVGGVDENSIANSQAKHTCSPSEIEVARSRRASSTVKNQCPSLIYIRCNQNIPSYDKVKFINFYGHSHDFYY